METYDLNYLCIYEYFLVLKLVIADILWGMFLSGSVAAFNRIHYQ
jgi:uncharacterized membrane protein